jgi:hypothetical protein
MFSKGLYNMIEKGAKCEKCGVEINSKNYTVIDDFYNNYEEHEGEVWCINCADRILGQNVSQDEFNT